MNLDPKPPQMPDKTGRTQRPKGEAQKTMCREEKGAAVQGDGGSGTTDLLQRALSRPNLLAALKRVKKNKGAPGIDGMTVEQLSQHLREHWPGIKEQLLQGTYQPKPVRQKLIPKGNGQMRRLGIPTALDRFIQQALSQVLGPVFEPSFSVHSHGFRPGHSAKGAILEAQGYIEQGHTWVVDIDLETFFDRVNHDVLMGRLAKKIADRRMLGLIRRYLEAGMMVEGVVMETEEGTPQGGPLSPLLANVLLDEVDKELEKRGHSFVRYADDCNVYVGSERAGQRVMALMRRLYENLRLKINESKSAVAQVWDRKILGYAFGRTREGKIQRRVAKKRKTAMKDKVRGLTGRMGGRSLSQVIERLTEYLRGWWEYFQLAETPWDFESLDRWIRRRLRAIQLKQWKRGTTIYLKLKALGLSTEKAKKVAGSAGRWWKASGMYINIAMPNSYFEKLGLFRLQR